MKQRSQRGITLIALVVTIIVLLILAGVAISLSIGENGIFKRAGQAADAWENASKNEEKEMNSIVDIIDNINAGNNTSSGNYDKEKKVNAPELKTGMTPIKFNEATASKKGEVVNNKRR